MAPGIGFYLIPLGMIANPHLILLEHAPVPALLAAAKMAAALAMVSFGIIAPNAAIKRMILVSGGLIILLI